MKRLKKGDKLHIQSYKHNGKPHRFWSEAVLVDVKKDYMVFANDRALVIKEKGSSWRTKEPAIIYCFKEQWFNIIAQFKKDGITYKCNIATPFIIEDNTIKCIDYELDLRIFSNGSFKILDRKEYQYNKKSMNYSKELDMVLQYSLSELIQLYKNNGIMFNAENNKKYLEEYRKMKDYKLENG